MRDDNGLNYSSGSGNLEEGINLRAVSEVKVNEWGLGRERPGDELELFFFFYMDKLNHREGHVFLWMKIQIIFAFKRREKHHSR